MWTLLVPTDPRIKLKESEKNNKYLDLARELKKIWMVILVIIGAFATVTKGLVQGVEDLEMRRRMETIQTTAFFRSVRILGRVLEI